MTPGEIIHLAVSGVVALVCLYVRAEASKVSSKIDTVRGELSERIYKLELKNFQDDSAVKDWARQEHENLRQWIDKYYQPRAAGR